MSTLRCNIGERVMVSPQLELTVLDVEGETITISIEAPNTVAPRDDEEPTWSENRERRESPFFAEFA